MASRLARIPSVREGLGPDEVSWDGPARAIRWCAAAASSQVREGGRGGTQLVPTQRPPESFVVVIAQTSMASVGEQENPLEEAMHDKLLYRIPEVVAILNVSRSKVYELLSSGTLPSVHIDRTRLVRHEDLVAYVQSLPMAG